MGMNYHDVIEYVKGITHETDPREMLDFAAQATDPLLSTVPVLFYQMRGGNLRKLLRIASDAEQDSLARSICRTFHNCLSCEETEPEFRESFWKLSAQIAEELGDKKIQKILMDAAEADEQVRERRK